MHVVDKTTKQIAGGAGTDYVRLFIRHMHMYDNKHTTYTLIGTEIKILLMGPKSYIHLDCGQCRG